MPSADRIYTVQVIWDETMADTAAKWLTAHPDGHIVILAGNGHCHDSAIVNRIKRRGVADASRSARVIDDGQGGGREELAKPMNDYFVVLELPPRSRRRSRADARQGRQLVAASSLSDNVSIATCASARRSQRQRRGGACKIERQRIASAARSGWASSSLAAAVDRSEPRAPRKLARSRTPDARGVHRAWRLLAELRSAIAYDAIVREATARVPRTGAWRRSAAHRARSSGHERRMLHAAHGASACA